MLNRLERLARRLAFLKTPALLLALGSALLFLTTFQLPAVLLLIWSLMLYSFTSLFQVLPACPEPRQSFFRRLKQKLQRSVYGLLAIIFLLLSLALLGLSLRGLFVYLAS